MQTQLQPIITDVELELKKNPSASPYAVFDFDDTCVMHDIQQALMALVCRNGLIRYSLLLGDEGRSLTKEAYHEAVFRHYWEMIHRGVTFEAYIYALRTLVGYSADEARSLYEQIVKDQGTLMGESELFGVTITKGFCVNEPVRELMETLHAKGVRLCVISASPQLLVEVALREDAFPEVTCVGTRLVEEGGAFVDKLVEPTPVEHGKILCVQELFGSATRPVLGIGDSMNDFSMIEYSTVHAAVDRGNQLAAEAKKRDWHLITHSI